jgi:hypothetical protein
LVVERRSCFDKSCCRRWFRRRFGSVAATGDARDRGCGRSSGALNAEQIWQVDSNMRAETVNLIEEIKQSVRLLRRHL